MKKLLFIAVLLFSISSFAQDPWNPAHIYCEMIGSGNFSGNNIKISFDFGNEGFSYKASDDNQLADEKGEAIKFSSMIDALNYMSARGWRLHTAFSAAVKGMGAQETYRYILVKELREGQSAMEGVSLVGDYKKSKNESRRSSTEEKPTHSNDDLYY